MSDSYIGKSPQYGYFSKQTLAAPIGGSAITLNATAADTRQLIVVVGGVVQEPETAYTLNVAGTQLTFTATPEASLTGWIIWLGKQTTGPRIMAGSITDQAALGTAPSAADTFVLFDDNAGDLKKVTYSNLIPSTHGDVSGPASSTDDALAKFDSTTGKIIQNSTATLSDAGTLTATAFSGPITGAVTATQVDITAQGDLRLQDTTGGQHVAIQAAGTVATSWTLTLPTDDGDASQFLQTNGSGVTTWATVTTDTSGAWTPGTSTTGKALVMGF